MEKKKRNNIRRDESTKKHLKEETKNQRNQRGKQRLKKRINQTKKITCQLREILPEEIVEKLEALTNAVRNKS